MRWILRLRKMESGFITGRSELIGLYILAIIAVLLIVVSISGESTRLHINFKEDDVLDPETKPDDSEPSQIIHVEAQYEETGPVRYNKEWVEVGNWTSESREIIFNITFEFMNIWYHFVQESGVDADAELHLIVRVNDAVLFDGTINLNDPGDEEIREFEMPIHEASADIDKDDLLSIMFEYSGYEDLMFYYDNATHDSGVIGDADFLYTWKFTAQNSKVKLETYDVFGSDWGSIANYIELTVDGNPVVVESIETTQGGTHNINGTDVSATLITWTLEESLDDGELIEAWVKYTRAEPDENKGMKINVITGDQIKPSANIKSIQPSPATEGEEVTFDASNSEDEDGTIEMYVWESDIDGEMYDGTESTFTKSDLSVGFHEITLRVQDDDGLWSDNASKSLEIREITDTSPVDEDDDDWIPGFELISLVSALLITIGIRYRFIEVL